MLASMQGIHPGLEQRPDGAICLITCIQLRFFVVEGWIPSLLLTSTLLSI